MSVDIVQPTALDRLRRLGGDNLVREMIELYLQQGRERVSALEAGLARADAAAVERAAHALKSSAGNLGAERLRHAAAALEALCHTGALDPSRARDVLAEYVASETALRAVLEGLDA